MSAIDIASDRVTVQTKAGLLSGLETSVRYYLGVPFAAPPVGELRWRPPQPAQAWQGIRQAHTFGPDPMQGNTAGRARSRATSMSEDCLTLNVWTPAHTTGKSLPVMVWFFGGGFTGGSAADVQFDGEALARKGVVVVTANYRLGVFGYMAHPGLTAELPYNASGNYGFLDNIAALQWVQDNIGAFGGDASRVTVFGQSAGGASAALLLVSPLAQGLFHRVILQSGGTGRPLGTLHAAEALGESVGTDLGELRRMPAEDLVKMNSKYAVAARGLTTPRMLRPIIDGWSIPEDERTALLAGRFAAVPIIIGTCSHEGNIGGNSPVTTVSLYNDFMRQNFGAMTDEALTLYPVKEDAEVRRELSQGLSDTQFQYGARFLAQVVSARERQTFRYIFGYSPDEGSSAKHGDDIVYVFGTLTAPGRDGTRIPTKADETLSAAIQDAWVRFAETGDPNGGTLPTWPTYNVETDPFLLFDKVTVSQNNWRRPQLDFLDRFFSQSEKGK